MDRLVKLIKGFFSLFVGNLEARNPRALIEAETVALQEALTNYNTNLAKQAGLVERLRTQIERQKKLSDQLTSKTKALMAAGQNEEAAQNALQLKQTNQEMADNQQQMKQADDLYKTLSQQRDVYVRDANKRIEAIKQKLSKAEIAEAQAKLAEIATSTGFTLSGSGATLSRLEEKLDERVAEATGKARVAADSAKGGEWTVKAEEEKAMANQALAEFAATMGMEAPAGVKAAPVSATRELGPTDNVTRELGPKETA
ncbi:MAG: PspA/IM30 family protein [Candidatus Xenobia bacterium]